MMGYQDEGTFTLFILDINCTHTTLTYLINCLKLPNVLALNKH